MFLGRQSSEDRGVAGNGRGRGGDGPGITGATGGDLVDMGRNGKIAQRERTLAVLAIAPDGVGSQAFGHDQHN